MYIDLDIEIDIDAWWIMFGDLYLKKAISMCTVLYVQVDHRGEVSGKP